MDAAKLRALADGTRREILTLLWEEEHTAGDIANRFDMSRPAISQHLRILKRADLVTDRAAGTRRLYAVNPDAIESLRTYFDRFWSRALAAFKGRIEEKSKEER